MADPNKAQVLQQNRPGGTRRKRSEIDSKWLHPASFHTRLLLVLGSNFSKTLCATSFGFAARSESDAYDGIKVGGNGLDKQLNTVRYMKNSSILLQKNPCQGAPIMVLLRESPVSFQEAHEEQSRF